MISVILRNDYGYTPKLLPKKKHYHKIIVEEEYTPPSKYYAIRLGVSGIISFIKQRTVREIVENKTQWEISCPGCRIKFRSLAALTDHYRHTHKNE